MAANDDEARVREILGSRTVEDPKKKRELEEKIAEAREKQKTGNLGLLLLLLVVLTALFAVVRYLMDS